MDKENKKQTNCVNYVAKNVVTVQVGENNSDFTSGCSVIDVTFPNIHYVEIKDISFKNYYTGWLTLKAKLKDSTNISAESKWKTCVKRYELMPDPHFEKGSEGYFVIPKSLMAFELNNVLSLRFVLRQSSPVWKEFKIEDIVLYKTHAYGNTNVTLPSWIKDSSKDVKPSRQIKGMGSISELSANLQKLWALVEQPQVPTNKFSTGRYDVDGSYDINLLSYT